MEPSVLRTRTLQKSRDKQGNLLINQYTLLRILGEGGYAVVRLAKFNEKYFVKPTKAVKIIKKEILRRKREFFNSPEGRMIVKNALEDVYKEISIIESLNHPHILKVHEIIDCEDSNKLYLSKIYKVQDFCENGCLLE